MEPKTVFARVDRLREIGVGVAYRKAPATPAQLSGRLRVGGLRPRRGTS